MLLAEVVAVSERVGATRSRTAKVAHIAELLRGADPGDLRVAVHHLAGRPRQGKVDVGWRTLGGVEVAPAEAPSLTVAEVDATIDRLAALGGAGSQEERHGELRHLLAAATEAEQRFLGGLLLGDVRHGALEGVVVQAVAVAFDVEEGDVRRALMLRADLGEVACAAAGGGAETLRGYALEMFRPVQPMLAKTAKTAAEVVAELGECAVEAKLDGARIQVHRAGGRIAVYSRSLRDITGDVPGVVDAVRALEIAEVILDGEVLGVADDGRPAAFQDTMRGMAGGSPFFFDCLRLDGEDLLDRPLAERRRALERIVGEGMRVARYTVDDPEAGERAYREVLDAGHEGVVVKDLDAPYAAGRRGAAWRKVKPVRTFDLVVLAAEWGSGRRTGWLSNLHLGARDPDGGFVMLGKTFKGLTDETLAWQTEALLAREVRREGPVVHVRPELVVEIALDGVVRSPRYPGGVSLRFARVVRYRGDKSPAEADELASLRALLPGW